MQALAAVQQLIDDLAPMPAEIGLQQPEAAEPEQDRQRHLREPVPPADAFVQQLQPVAQDLGRTGWIERHGWEGPSLQIVAGHLLAYLYLLARCGSAEDHDPRKPGTAWLAPLRASPSPSPAWSAFAEVCMTKHFVFDSHRRKLLLAGCVTSLVAALAPRRAAGADKIPIGVIGSGHIGGTVGGLWVADGHPVLFSSRHPDELGDLVRRLGPLARAGTVAQAIAFGDALLVAVPYKALPELGHDHAAALRGKIVLDACNAVAARDGAAIADEVERDGIGVTSRSE